MCIESICKCGHIWYPKFKEQAKQGENQVCPECGNRADSTISNTFDEPPHTSYRNFNSEEQE